MAESLRRVVGAAILRRGQVLAARRTTPPAAAGRWEFPGGKIEPGESPDQALAREIHEELGCIVSVGDWLPGEVVINDTHLLTVAFATLLGEAEPHPHEHDQLRWLGVDELEDVDWLEPDRPFLDDVRRRMMTS